VARACRTPRGSRGSGMSVNTSISGRRDSPAVGDDGMAAGDFRDGIVWELDRHGPSAAVPSATLVTSVTHVTAAQRRSATTLPTPCLLPSDESPVGYLHGGLEPPFDVQQDPPLVGVVSDRLE
jgi:hypothetical protein